MKNNISIGKYTYSHNNDCYQQHVDGKIVVGNFCSIAKGVAILSSTSSHNYHNITSFPFGHINQNTFNNIPRGFVGSHIRKDCTTIGNDVYLCQNCIITPGVTVADGCIIAAGAVVTQDTEPFTIIGGTNKVLKKRFDQKYIDVLLKIKWWNWPDKIINQSLPLITSPPNDRVVEELINIHKTIS